MRKRIELNIAACQFCKTELTFADTIAMRNTDFYRPCKNCRSGFRFRFLQFIEELRPLNFSDLFRKKNTAPVDLTPAEQKAMKAASRVLKQEQIEKMKEEHPGVEIKQLDLSKIAPKVENTDKGQEKAFVEFCHSVKNFGVVMAHTNGKDKVLLYPTDKIPEAIKPGNLPLYTIMSRKQRRRK